VADRGQAGSADDDGQQVVERELALLDPAVRADADRVRSLLHVDFVEYGASGRIWDRTSITSVIAGSVERIIATDMRVRRLGPDAVLLTYRSEASGRRASRSSVWVRDERAGWVLLFHQGTSCG
jgi:hypothetical protein